MTIGEPQDALTCRGQKEAEWREEKDARPSRGCTALSTIAVQAGHSQIVISVLKSGTLVHLQLIQVHPDLCEIGSNQEENQTLIREQQQLLDKLKKHESEVLAVVEKNQNVHQQREGDVGMGLKKSKKQEEEREVYKAMTLSLKEGWSLLLQLMEKRQEALTLTSDFYCKALEFAESIDRVENLQIVEDNNILTEVKLQYDSLRKDLLGKSLRVMTSSNILLQKLNQLQRTEALLRRGGVLQDEEKEECSKSSQGGRGVSLRVEELVEMLQDRRRRVDQAIRVHLHQTEDDTRVKTEQVSTQAGFEDSYFTLDILDQILQDAPKSDVDLQSKMRITDQQDASNPELSSNLNSEIRLNQKTGLSSIPEYRPDLKMENKTELVPESRINLKPEPKTDLEHTSRSDINPKFKSEFKDETKPYQIFDLESTSDRKSMSSSELRPESKLELMLSLESISDLKLESISDSEPDSESEPESEAESDPNPDSKLSVKPESDSNWKHGSIGNIEIKSTSDTMSDSRSVLTDETKLEPVPESGLILKPDSKADLEPKSKTDINPLSEPELNPETNRDLNIVFEVDLHPEYKSDLKSDPWSDLNLKFRSNPKSKFTFDMKPKFTSAVKLESRPELIPETESDLKPECSSDLKLKCSLSQKIESNSTIMPESRSELRGKLKSELEPESRLNIKPDPKKDLTAKSKTDTGPEYNSEPKPDTNTELKTDLTSYLKLESNLDLKSKSASDVKDESKSGLRSEPWSNLKFKLRSDTNSPSDMAHKSASDIKQECKPELIPERESDKKSESYFDLKDKFSSSEKTESRLPIKPQSRSEYKAEIRSEMEPESREYLRPVSKTDLRFKSNTNKKPDYNPELKSKGNTDLKIGISSDLKPKFTSDIKLESNSELNPVAKSEMDPDSRSDVKPDTTLNLKLGSGQNLKLESTLTIMPDSVSGLKSENVTKCELMSGSELYQKPDSKIELSPKSKTDILPECNSELRPETNTDQRNEFRSDLKSECKSNLKPKFTSKIKPQSNLVLKSWSALTIESTLGMKPKSALDMKLESKPELKSDAKSDLKSEPSSELKLSSGQKIECLSDIMPESKSEHKIELEPESRLCLKPDSKADMKSKSGSDMKPGELEIEVDMKSDLRSILKHTSKSDIKSDSKVDLKPGPWSTFSNELRSKSEFTPDLKAECRSDRQPGSADMLEFRSNQKTGSGLAIMPECRLEPTTEIRLEQKPDTKSYLKFKSDEHLKLQFRKNGEPEYKSEQKPDSNKDLIFISSSPKKPEFKSDLKPDDSSPLKSEPNSGQTHECKAEMTDQQPKFRFNLKSPSKSHESKNEQPGLAIEETNISPKPKSRADPNLEFESNETYDLPVRSTSETSESVVELMHDSHSDLRPEYISNIKPESRPDLKSTATQDGIKDSQPNSTSGLRSGSRSQQTRNFNSGDTFNPRPEIKSDLSPESTSDETQNLPYESASVASRVKQFEQKNSTAGLVQSTDLPPVSRNFETRTSLKPKSRSHLKLDSSAEETMDLQSGFILDEQSVQSENRLNMSSRFASVQSGKLSSGFLPAESNSLQPEVSSEKKSESRSQEITDVHNESSVQESGDQQSRLGLNVKQESISDHEPGLRPEKTCDLQSVSSVPETNNLKPGSKAEMTTGSKSELKPGPPSQQSPDLESESASQKTRRSGSKSETEEEHNSPQNFWSDERQELLSSCEHLVDKVWSWVQQSSTMLSCSCEAGHQLSEAEDTLKTHLQLRSQAEAAGCDAEKMRRILEQIKTLHTDLASRTTSLYPSDTSKQTSDLKALTVQLKRGHAEGWDRTGTMPAVPHAAGLLSSELDGRVALVMDDLQTLCRSIESNLQLLQPYVTFLRTAEQVEGDMEELREAFRRPEDKDEDEKEEIALDTTNYSTMKKKQNDANWQETMQRLLNAQELGNNYIHTATMVLVSGLNLQSVISVVQRTVERLSRSIQEVNDLQSQHQIQNAQQEEDTKYCRKYHKRLNKCMQDLKSVSELLDSCTVMDLGSDPQTSKLLEHFSQARPHFMKLNAEAEFLAEGWETLRGVQCRLGLKEVKEEDLSQLLNLHQKVKEKILQSELILDLSSTFHLTTKKLETLLKSGLASMIGSANSNGSDNPQMCRQKEDQEQIQNLFNTASTLKTDICNAISSSGWTHFKAEELETSLRSLDSLCVSWVNEAVLWEEKLQREQLTHQLNNDIKQLRDSFKDVKKRFSNLKFNYLKRNDRTRNMKAARNQLQQVKVYEEKLQALWKRLQGLTARLGSEVKDGGAAREAEDAVNELQRQMGEFERNVYEHQKTLDMTCKLQQAMEEYQFWCEEASATIARVGKFSSECRSTEAVSVLYQQFEKFVWPTVPQQEERISQITELAVRLHGLEEGQRYIEKTVSKHSEMVASIKELSDGLMKLEAKLKEKNDKEKEKREVTQSGRENETEVKDEDKTKLKENKKLKRKEQMDNCTQETAEMLELKETGHTPELTNKHDGREMLVRRQSATRRKPPLQKSRSQESDKQTVSSDNRHQTYSERLTSSPRPPSSYCSTHTFSLSSSPVEAGRRVHSVNSQLQLVAPDPQATHLSMHGPSFSDIQREFRIKEDKDKDTLAEGLTEAALQQHDLMTEDCLSADEYECISPDDISLPPLAETPESIMVQSDVEESVCVSSHGIVQCSQQHHTQQEQSRSRTGSVSGAIRHQRVSSRTEGCPTPPIGLHSGTRFISESNSFAQNMPTAPVQTLFTSTLCSILRTKETCITNIPQSANIAVPCPESTRQSESKPDCKIATLECSSNKDNLTSPGEHISQEDSSQHKRPTRNSSTQIKVLKNTVFNNENFPQSNTICPVEEKDQINSVLQCSLSVIQTSSGPKSSHNNLSQNKTIAQTYPVSQIGQFAQSSLSESVPLNDHSTTQQRLSLQNETVKLFDAASQRRSISQNDTVISQAKLQYCQDSRNETDKKLSSSQTNKEVCPSQNSSLTTTAIVNHQLNSCQSENECNNPQLLGSQQNRSFSQRGGSACAVLHVPTSQEPATVNNSRTCSSIASSGRFCGKESNRTVYSLHESLASTCSQQFVHDLGMIPSCPAKPYAPSQPEAKAQALAQQANLHVTPPSPLPHLLTPDEDPDICQPMAIREEIRLTPQIQGPALSATTPPPPVREAQAESLPQGKASKPGPTCFSRPLSRATVMEGSPVTLEVEVTGHQEPMLTWSKDGEVSASGRGQALASEDGKHSLLIPEASDGEYETQAPGCPYLWQAADNSSSKEDNDRWLVAEVFDIISEEWQTWFGTLCVLLWLLYLIIL